MKKIILNIFALVVLGIASMGLAQNIMGEPCEPPFGPFPPEVNTDMFNSLNSYLEKLERDKYFQDILDRMDEQLKARIPKQFVSGVSTTLVTYFSSSQKHQAAVLTDITACAANAKLMTIVEKGILDKAMLAFSSGQAKEALGTIQELTLGKDGSELVNALAPRLIDTFNDFVEIAGSNSTEPSTLGVFGRGIGQLVGGVWAAAHGADPGAGADAGGGIGEAIGEAVNDIVTGVANAADAIAEGFKNAFGRLFGGR